MPDRERDQGYVQFQSQSQQAQIKEFARTDSGKVRIADAGKVCVAAYWRVSMCCMRTHERTDYLPRKVCYEEMLYM